MSKEFKKSVKSEPPLPSSTAVDNFAGGVVALICMAIIWRWLTSRSSYEEYGRAEDFNPSHRRGSATDKQMRYLADLVSSQNFFRSKPISFDDWISKKASSGFVSARFASDLIQSLKAENQDLREKFEAQKRRRGVGRFRGEIYVHDLRTFFFCERAAYYSVLQYPSQNLVELGFGHHIHQAYSDSEHRDSERPARVIEFIKAQESSIERVEWLQNSVEASFRHPSLPVSGRPDGFFHFRDGTRSIVELKSVAKLPDVPRTGDFIQADIYALLAPVEAKVREESFVLYTDRSSREVALHKKQRSMTEYDLAKIVAKIERGVGSRRELKAATSVAQCTSCGYRSICSSRIRS